MKLGLRHNKLVSFDINYRSLLWDGEEEARMQIMSVLQYVELLKVSDEEKFLIGGEKQIPKLMNDFGIPVVVLTRGSKGARVYFKGRVMNMEAIKADVADTNGAGDAFWGGFLTSLLDQNISLAEELDNTVLNNALKYGIAAGWLAVQKHGAIPALPTRGQIEDALCMIKDGGE